MDAASVFLAFAVAFAFCIQNVCFKLEYSCFIVCWISALRQSEPVTLYTPSFFRFPSHLGYHRALDRTPVLYSQFSLIIYFIKMLLSHKLKIRTKSFGDENTF